MSKAREGLNCLLELKPDATVVEVVHQTEVNLLFDLWFTTHPGDQGMFMRQPAGPWTLATLKEEETNEFASYKCYAIWNETGNVYETMDGVVADDPFIEVTPPNGGNNATATP